MRVNFKLPALLIVFWCTGAAAQDINLDSLLDADMKTKNQDKTQHTEATFKTSRLIDGHTVETTQRGVLDLKVSHRFGRLNEGFYNMFGFDVASMRIGLDYGITDRLTVGGGRSTFEKQYDLFLKYRLLWQSEGKNSMPVSVTFLSSLMFETDTTALKSEKNISVKPRTSDKLSYAHQILLSRKFNSNFSLQLMPTMVHENLVDSTFNSNDLFSVGVGARLKLTQRSSINIEYYYQLPGYKLPGTYNTLSLGYEIETGGHVFQLHLSNSTGMTERTFIAENNGRWSKGDIHFGFNISRVFTLKKPKELKM
jgi:hypothetical protein